jgi:glycerate 2-kinase
VGKASPFMAVALAGRLPGRIASGVVIGTHCPIALPPPLEWIEGSHPVPDARSERAGRRALETAAAVGDDELLLVLISGGASALMVQPRDGVSLRDKQETTRQLLLAGADIGALNTVRKHLSAVKGGQLAAAARGRTVALAVSDVVGDDLSVIGSGPTVADPSRFADAVAVIERHGGWSRFPLPVRDLLLGGARGEAPETPKPGDAALARATTRLIGSRRDALEGAAARAGALGYAVTVLSEPIVGEARDAGSRLAREAPSGEGPTCVIAAGETTVTVRGKGRGGRNQELVLSAARELAAASHPVAMLSGGTDGVDGPTDAAGAVADHTTIARAAALGLDPGRVLDDNDAYAFFSALSDLVVTGPTDTNVGDIQILLRP